MNKIVILCIIALCLSSSLWAYDFESDGIYYEITSAALPYTVAVTYKVAYYSSYSGAVNIPSSVTYLNNTYTVDSIGDLAFYCCTDLTSITIPSSVISIGDWAFSTCTGLTTITIPSSVTSIGDRSFYYCLGLTTITIPSSVTSIGEYAFYVCTGLTSITIPSSVTTIGEGAFRGCPALIAVDANNPKYTSLEGVLFDKSITYLLCCPTSKTGSFTIPSSVSSIGDWAFSNCTGLTSITIPSSVTSIGEHAFCYCESLTSITIPFSVTSIGKGIFAYCTGITSITIPSSVTTIESEAFYVCTGLTSLTIPSSVTYIGNDIFNGCFGLTSIYSLSSTPVDADISYNVNITCPMYVPIGSKSAYQAATGWKDFENIVEMDAFAVSANTVSLSASGGSTYVNVFSPSAWAISTNVDWITLSQSNGSGNTSVSFTATANLTTVPRTAIITVSCTGFTNQLISLTQEGASATGINLTDKNPMSIYPNPATNVLYFNNIKDNAKISIFDINGKLKLEKTISDGKLYIGQLANGLYSVRIYDNSKIKVLKLVKE